MLTALNSILGCLYLTENRSYFPSEIKPDIPAPRHRCLYFLFQFRIVQFSTNHLPDDSTRKIAKKHSRQGHFWQSRLSSLLITHFKGSWTGPSDYWSFFGEHSDTRTRIYAKNSRTFEHSDSTEQMKIRTTEHLKISEHTIICNVQC